MPETHNSTTALVLTLTRSGRAHPSGNLSVIIVSESRTATEGSDYLPINEVLVFGDGATAQTFTVTVLDDDIYEVPDEHFELRIADVYYRQRTNPPNPHLQTSEINRTSVVILDDGDAGTFEFVTTAAGGGSAGPLALRESIDGSVRNVHSLTITRTGREHPSGNISIFYATADTLHGRAKFGHDYLPTEGWVDFSDGQTQAVLSVTVLDDDEFEFPDEYFEVALTSARYIGQAAANVPFGPNRAVNVTIMDDGDLGFLKFAPTVYSTPEGTVAHLTVTRFGRSNMTRRLTARYRCMNGSATYSDFVPSSGVVDFDGSTTLAVFNIETLDDEVRARSRLELLAS